MRYLNNVSASIATVLKPAGLEKSKGAITAIYEKDATDARWKEDAGFKQFAAFIVKYMSPNTTAKSRPQRRLWLLRRADALLQVLKPVRQ